jgi:hypothetical protein
MLDPAKTKASVLLTLGKRDEAKKILQDTYNASDEEANKLLLALEADLKQPFTKLPGRKKLLHYVGVALTVLGFIVGAVGSVGYFSFSTPEMEWLRTTCTVSKIDEAGRAITFSYEYNGQPYSKQDVSSLWPELGLQEGQTLELLVNPEWPEDILLPLTKPYLQESMLTIIINGAVLLAIAVVLWIVRKRM